MRAIIEIEDREDGGIRVCSSTHTGLILSGGNADLVMADVLPALRALEAHRHLRRETGNDGWLAMSCAPLTGKKILARLIPQTRFGARRKHGDERVIWWNASGNYWAGYISGSYWQNDSFVGWRPAP